MPSVRRMLPLFALLVVARSIPSSAGPAEGKALVLADFAQAEEPDRWALGNSGPKSKVEAVAGPGGAAALQVTCAFEPQLAPQAHSPAPYMPFRRAIDGAALAQENATRLTFWHRGDSAQVVFTEKERGDCYHHSTGDSKEWRRVAIPFVDFRFGWSQGGKGKGEFDLARMEAVHLAVSPAPGETRRYAFADLRLERSVEDLDPRTFIGSRTPARIGLHPRTVRLPANRTQPVLAIVANEDGCGLEGIPVNLALTGAGTLLPAGAPAAAAGTRSLRLKTDAEGKARALYQPSKDPSSRAAVMATATGTPIPPARAEVTTAPALRKVRLGPDGFFAGPDGGRVMPLGGLFLPWWGPVENGELKGMSPLSILGASDAEQDAWLAYLKANGINCIRGYWPWGAPLKIGPDGTEVRHIFDLDGKPNEPVIAALERMMAVGGRHGIGFTLTIADCARHFLGGYGYRTEVPEGKTRRQLLREAESFLRELVPRLAHNPNVWAYELTNEQGGATYDWSDYFIRVVKDLDPVTPVMVSHGGGALQTADPLAWMVNTGLDVYQPHHYPDAGHTLFQPDVDAGLMQEVHYNAMAGPKPWLLGESGGYGTHPPMGPEPDAAAQQYLARDCIWFALLNRSIGASIWGIKHHATTQFRLAAEIAREVDWPALARARAMVGVSVPRDAASKAYFRSEEGRRALRVMAEYARWSLRGGVSVDFVPDAAGYAVRRSALEPFDPPKLDAPLRVGEGYQVKHRMSADGKLVVAYVRNVARIALHKPDAPAGWQWKVTGSHIRVRQPTTVQLQWRLPGARYDLVVWDLDTGEKRGELVPGSGGSWQREGTGHDFVLMWRQR